MESGRRLRQRSYLSWKKGIVSMRLSIAQRTAGLVIALLLSACVPSVSYTRSAPNADSALKALVAERNLTHYQAQLSRQIDPDFTELSFCSADGSRIVIHAVRITDGGVCGREMRLETTESSEQRPERCWQFKEISTVGQPRDAMVVGYYPVRGYLRCPNG